MELVVVAVGVLLALWAQQWVESREQRKADAMAIEAMRINLLRNIGHLAVWRSLDACHREQLVYLHGRLVNSGRAWSGIDRRALYLTADRDRVFGGFYTLASNRPTSVAWDNALAAGVVDRMDPRLRGAYGRAFAVFDGLRQSMDAIADARQDIEALAFPGALSDADRFAALNSLTKMDGGREYIARERHFVEFTLTARERAMFEDAMKRWVKMLDEGGVLRPCFQGVRLPDIFDLENLTELEG